MKLLVYVPLLTPRIKYVFNFIFSDILKTEVGFSSNLAEFKSSALPKITYADQPVSNEPFFKNSDLLLSHTIVRPNIKTTTFGDMIVPFAVDNSSLPFDVFAAAFYFVSRFEEYLPFKAGADAYYPAEYSLQNKLKMLEFPVIDGWALMLKNILLKRYPALHFGKKTFEFHPLICMHDCSDHSLMDVIKNSFLFLERLPFIKKSIPVPAKTTNLQLFLNSQHEKYQLKPIYFTQPAQQIDQDNNRQVSLPNSYLELLKNGVANDYRMGYLNTPGFRAGTCTPFLWYDLQLEKTTHLRIHPIAVNDLMLGRNRTFNIEATLSKWGSLIQHVQLLSGSFYIVWHKETLPDAGKGKIGRRLYTQLLSNFLSLPDDIQPE